MNSNYFTILTVMGVMVQTIICPAGYELAASAINTDIKAKALQLHSLSDVFLLLHCVLFRPRLSQVCDARTKYCRSSLEVWGSTWWKKKYGKQLEELRGMSRMRFDYQTDPRADSMYKSRLSSSSSSSWNPVCFPWERKRSRSDKFYLLRQERSTAEVMFAASANIDPLLKLYKCIMADWWHRLRLELEYVHGLRSRI